MNQFRLLHLVQVGLAAEPNEVNSTGLSLLWRDALANDLITEPEFSEADFFAALPALRLPRVSVIVPVFNGATHVVEMVESVLAQTYSDYELIIVDDGSTDRTAELLRPYRGQIRLIQQSNQGVSAARNLGLALALGDFVLFLDSDDLLYPDKLAQQVAHLEANHLLGAVHSGWRLVDEYGRPLRNITPWQQVTNLHLPNWLKWKPVFLGAMLFRRSWLQRIAGFRTDLRQAEDTDFLLRLALAGCPMEWLKEITIDYRQHGAGVTRNGLQQAVDMSHVLDDFFGRQDLAKPIRELESEVRQYTLIWLVWQLYRTGFPHEIGSYFRQAISASEAMPPTILAQTWLVQFATYAREEGLDLNELKGLYPDIKKSLEFEEETWPFVERMLTWWLTHWQQLHLGQRGSLPEVQNIVHAAIHLEREGHIRSAIEWSEWWLKVWRLFLPHENCGAGHEMDAFLDKTAAEVVALAQGSILFAPNAVETWQIMVFWYRAQESGLIRPSENYRVLTLYLTYFGQALLGRQWHRALRAFAKAFRASFQLHAPAAWRDFIQLGIRYWRKGRRNETAV